MYAEEREWNLRIVMRCEFPEDYEGELDGYAWAEDAPQITNAVLRAAITQLSQRPGWKLGGGNRGRPAEDEITLVLERVLPGVSPVKSTKPT